MAKNKKPQKSLLNENTVRRMMKLANIPELSESYFNEKQGYDDEEDESLGMRTGKEADKEQSEKDRRDDSYGKWGKRDETLAEESEEESELHATEDELGAEDDVADEESDELDAEASEGEAEITPEQAAAVVELAPVIADLAASLEAGGAAEGGEEVEAEVEIGPEGGEEVEELDEFRGLEEQLAKLGIEVMDDKVIKETVYKRVIKRLTNEQRRAKTARKTDQLVERIFIRLQRESKKATKKR